MLWPVRILLSKPTLLSYLLHVGRSTEKRVFLVPPSRAVRSGRAAPTPTTRPTTPLSSVTMGSYSGASTSTMQKQTFFNRLRALPYSVVTGGSREPSVSDSSSESAPKPISKTSLLSALKDSLRGRSSGSSSDDKKIIGRPRPFLPSLGAYLQKDYERQMQVAAQESSVKEEPPKPSPLYSMQNKPLSIPSSVSMKPNTAANEPVTKTATSHSGYRTATSGSTSRVLTKGSAPSTGIGSNPSGSASTLATATGLKLKGAIPEVPQRRGDFKPRNSAASARSPGPSSYHGRIGSQDSAHSIAVISTAAFAVRSPLVEASLVPSPRPAIKTDAPQLSAELSAKARLVQFNHERLYDDGSSSGDDRVAGAHQTYQGKREISQKALVHGSSGTPPELWEDIPQLPKSPLLEGASRSFLAHKVQMLRDNSRRNHERQMHEISQRNYHAILVSPPTEPLRLAPEPEDLNDPNLALGIHYVRTLGSDGDLSPSGHGGARSNGVTNSAIFFSTPPPLNDRGESSTTTAEKTGIALGGDELMPCESQGSVTGRARMTTTSRRPSRPR